MSPLLGDNFDRAQRAYDNMEPPEMEAVECGDCLTEMQILVRLGGEREHRCLNPWCPAKFEIGSVARDMADRIMDLEDTLHRCEQRIKFFARQVEALGKGLQK